MSVVSGSTLVDVPGVALAVQHLQEFAIKLKTKEPLESENNSKNILAVIEAIQELVFENAKIHEKLETETIRACILRHKLKNYPGEIEQEIQRAVDAARQSNAAELDRLRSESQAIDDNIALLQRTLKELTKDNEFLLPERDRVQSLYEDIITQLNERLAEKANLQIHLNETRMRTNDTNQKMADLEEGILQLRDDMIEERTTYKQEKARLVQANTETQLKLEDQTETNVAEKKVLDVVYVKVKVLDKKISTLKDNTVNCDLSRNEHEAKSDATLEQLENVRRINAEVSMKSQQMVNSWTNHEEEYRVKKSNLTKTIQELTASIKDQKKQTERLTEKNKKTHYIFKEKLKIREADEKKIKQKNADLQKLKDDLTKKSAEMARLNNDIQRMQQKTVELSHTHKTIVESLNRQIEDCRNHLAKERKERMDVESELEACEDSLQTVLADGKRSKFESDMKVKDGKARHDALTKQGFQLQQQIKESQDTIVKLRAQVKQAKIELEETEKLRNGEVSKLQREMEAMNQSIEKAENQLSIKQPEFDALERLFADKTAGFEQTKKDLVASKSKKIAVEAAIRNAGREIEELLQPQAALRIELSKTRAKSMARLKERMVEIEDVERNVLAAGNKLTIFLNENKRFTEAIASQEVELSSLVDQTAYNEDVWKKLTLELENFRKQLVKEWLNEDLIRQNIALRDQATVDEFGALIVMTEDRQNVVSTITNRLESELAMLTDFLENVARRRPKTSRRGTARQSMHDGGITKQRPRTATEAMSKQVP